jgi:arylsulfatase A-like enzyme
LTRALASVAGGLLLVLAAACSDGGANDADRAARNLLIVSIDTLRADHLGLYGYERPTSPHLDAFAKDAVVFDSAQAHSSWTLPSFASMMTSLYSATHACLNFDSQLDGSFLTLAEVLRGAEFHTAAVASHVFLGRRHGLHQGFAEFDDELVLELNESHAAITSPTVTDKGIARLERRAAADERFFLWLHYFDPHELYKVHEGISEQFGVERDIDRYDGEIAFTDREIGRLFDAVDRLGLGDDTIVVVVADHGEQFMDHGNQRHGRDLHRETVRVPLLVRAPGFEPRRVAPTVRMVDLMPTLLELLDVEPPPVAEGLSVTRLMRGEPQAELPALAELSLRPDFRADSLALGRWKLIVDHSGASRRDNTDNSLVIVDEDGLRRFPIGEPVVQLFDLETDLLETENVAAEHPDTVASLRDHMERLIERGKRLVDEGLFERGAVLDLSPEELARLSALGYVGESAPVERN